MSNQSYLLVFLAGSFLANAVMVAMREQYLYGVLLFGISLLLNYLGTQKKAKADD